MARLEQKMGAEDFWKDQEAAQKMLQRRKRLEGDLGLLKRLRTQEDDARVLVEWLEAGEDVEKDLRGRPGRACEATVEGAEFQKMLGGEHDRANAILTINAGAGGTESQDWAEMLLRMYLRWCDRKGFKRDITEIQAGRGSGHQERDRARAGRVRLRLPRPPRWASTAWSASAPSTPRRAATPRSRRCSPGRRSTRTSRSRSRTRTSASTPTARAGRAASTST